MTDTTYLAELTNSARKPALPREYQTHEAWVNYYKQLREYLVSNPVTFESCTNQFHWYDSNAARQDIFNDAVRAREIEIKNVEAQIEHHINCTK